MYSIVKLSDVNGEPKVITDLPQLKIGDPIALRFRSGRSSAGRYEVLEVNGRFRVTMVGYDASGTVRKQLLSVDCIDKPPTWRSVKKPLSTARRLGPAVFPPTPID